jgi:hypothetical protein
VCLLTLSGLFALVRDGEGVHLIGFLSNRDGSSEIFVMAPDGSAEHQLTFTDMSDLRQKWGYCWFDWSQDGLDIYKMVGPRRLQFECWGGGFASRTNIVNGYEAKVDFGAYVPFDSNITQSPDGNSFVFVSTPQIGSGIYSGLVRYFVNEDDVSLLRVLGDIGVWRQMIWSPNREWFLLVKETHEGAINTNLRIIRTHIEDQAKAAMTIPPELRAHICQFLAVSSDSNWIMFVGRDEFGDCSVLYRTRLDTEAFGSEIELVDDLEIRDQSGAFYSPFLLTDGTKLSWSLSPGKMIFVSGDGVIHFVAPVGESIWQGNPVWSPDGGWVVFAASNQYPSNRYKGYTKIYQVRPDGSELEPLTEGAYDDVQPKYSPPIDLPYHDVIPLGLGAGLLLVGLIRPRRRSPIL